MRLLPFLFSTFLVAQQRPSPESIHRYETQRVVVDDFAASGYVLDIGGGGEGVMGQMKPRQVIAIDLIKRELEEAPAGPLKIVMDATDLKFLDKSFDTATAFFSLMYMAPEAQEKACREVNRVLKPGGKYLIWDVILPNRFDDKKEVAVFPMQIKIPGKDIKTGYGTFFPAADHDVAYFKALAEKTGFRVAEARVNGRNFYMELVKPY